MAARKHPAKHKADGTFKASKRGKYNAKGRHVNGQWCASKAEADRYEQLLEMEKRGDISSLETQKKFPCRVNNIIVCHYVADFTYWAKGDFIIEDVKGMQTEVYKLKKKLLAAAMGVHVTELPATAVPRSRFLNAIEATTPA